MDELLRSAGLSRADFYNIKSVERSDVSGRILVTTSLSLQRHPVELRRATNLVAVAHLEAESLFIFNQVEQDNWDPRRSGRYM